MSLDYRIVIPARYASVRLPGKPLRSLCGKPMVEWVYRAACEAGASDVVVATDDQRIADRVREFGGQACLTDSAHRSGTDRIVEVARQLKWSSDTIVVNLQGDEPLMPVANIVQVAANLAELDCAMTTLHKVIDIEAARNPNLVKLVQDTRGYALYFSRSLIPYDRNGGTAQYLGHIGIYAYRVGFVETFSRLEPCELEISESLEQLRALWNGYAIHSEAARAAPGPGVDTEADLEAVSALIESQQA